MGVKDDQEGLTRLQCKLHCFRIIHLPVFPLASAGPRVAGDVLFAVRNGAGQNLGTPRES